jgi:predicted metal-dependent hydrolase
LSGPSRPTIEQGGRPKAYRPMPEPERRAALAAGLDAYDRGDFFLAHELLEPAWMGGEDLAERELLQGLIKLAAAFVHDARGNPGGVAKNLRGALARIEAGTSAGARLGIDADALAAVIRRRVAEAGTAGLATMAITAGTGGEPGIPIPRLR